MNPEKLVRAITEATLPPDSFGHRAHIVLAWQLLRRHALPEAMAAYRDTILHYCAAHGVTGKYHETMTFALLVLIAERLEIDQCWSEFEAANPDLFENWRGLLGQHYRDEELDSATARRRFVLPRRVA